MSDKLYNIMKWTVIIFLPALGTLYTSLSQVWGLPYATEIPATVVALETFLGAVLCISSANYNKKGSDKNE